MFILLLFYYFWINSLNLKKTQKNVYVAQIILVANKIVRAKRFSNTKDLNPPEKNLKLTEKSSPMLKIKHGQRIVFQTHNFSMVSNIKESFAPFSNVSTVFFFLFCWFIYLTNSHFHWRFKIKNAEKYKNVSMQLSCFQK